MPLRRFLLVSALLLVVLGVRPTPGSAQEEGEAYLSVTPGSGAVVVDLGRLLRDRTLASAIHDGLPLRIRVEAELWRDRLFDSEVGTEEWKASILYDPVTLRYEVQIGEGEPERFASLGEAREHLHSSFELRLRPTDPGRYYYLAVVEMQTLSLSDLEELRRWLNGDLGPAVGGDTGLDAAVARGVRRLFVRALGLPTRRVRLRTEAFSFEGGDTP